MQRVCHIIGPSMEDVSKVSAVVQSVGWATTHDEGSEAVHAVEAENSLRLVEQADAVLVILTGDDSPGSLFRIGFAIARSRPLLLIGSDEAVLDDQTPDRILASLPRVRATTADQGSLRLYIAAFLDGLKSRSQGSGAGADAMMDPTYKKSTVFPRRAPHSALEKQLVAMFELSVEFQAFLLQPSPGPDATFVPDFAAWFANAHPLMPNPLIVEAYNGFHDGGRTYERLRSYASESGIATVMLVDSSSNSPLSMRDLSPMTFVVGLEQLQRLLGQGILLESMAHERNAFVHSAGR